MNPSMTGICKEIIEYSQSRAAKRNAYVTDVGAQNNKKQKLIFYFNLQKRKILIS